MQSSRRNCQDSQPSKARPSAGAPANPFSQCLVQPQPSLRQAQTYVCGIVSSYGLGMMPDCCKARTIPSASVTFHLQDVTIFFSQSLYSSACCRGKIQQLSCQNCLSEMHRPHSGTVDAAHAFRIQPTFTCSISRPFLGLADA